jgi:uncharacterized protein (DUF433 family)
LDYLASGITEQEIPSDFLYLEAGDIRAALPSPLSASIVSLSW